MERDGQGWMGRDVKSVNRVQRERDRERRREKKVREREAVTYAHGPRLLSRPIEGCHGRLTCGCFLWSGGDVDRCRAKITRRKRNYTQASEKYSLSVSTLMQIALREFVGRRWLMINERGVAEPDS